jgi:metal-responsive CopG/Arc/MetJ family transcriptional regulator
MTRSELMRTALRNYLEEQASLEAIRVYETERNGKKLKKLRSLAELMS